MNDGLQDFITQEILNYIQDYTTSMKVQNLWEEPLVGFADAKDPLFLKLKGAVSPSHSMPHDLLEDAQTVIVYFLPFDKDIPKKNRYHRHASIEWAQAYIETNRLIVHINNGLSDRLSQKGFKTKIMPPTHNFDKQKLISDWSHRHIAYVAGLGKFGIHNLLITDRGCCGRLGSIVTNMEIAVTKRTNREYCLHKYNRTCKICVKKCVTEALQADSFDRHKCYRMLLENSEIFLDEGLADVCGKCISIVPCSFHNPVIRLQRD